MRILIWLAAGVSPLLTARIASAQDGHMMDGGLWIAVPLVLAVVGLVAWAERQKYK